MYIFEVPRPKSILNHSQNEYSAWADLWFHESGSFSLMPPCIIVSVHVPADDTVQTWPLAPSASARLSVRVAVASQCYTDQNQLVKYAYRFSDLHLHLAVYLGDTQHDWCWSRLHLFCITVKQTMKEPWMESSKVLLSACHLPAWVLQVGKTAREILCRSFYFKLKMLQDYYVMRHHEKYLSGD